MIAMDAPEREGEKRTSLWHVVTTVLFGFFGVRRRAHHEAGKLTPVQVIIAGLIGAAVFVGILLVLVNFILSRVGAGA